MHAYLIVGSTSKAREEKLQSLLRELEAGEIVTLEEKKSYLISDVRTLQRRLKFATSGTKPRIVAIKDAHLMTDEAANAFLKTLEEPPANTIIIMTSPNQDLVLATIASRTQLIDLGARATEVSKENIARALETLDRLLSSRVGEKLKFLESIKNREEALEFCTLQILATREKMLTTPYNLQPTTYLIELLEQTRQDLEANVNVKMALGNLLLSYH